MEDIAPLCQHYLCASPHDNDVSSCNGGLDHLIERFTVGFRIGIDRWHGGNEYRGVDRTHAPEQAVDGALNMLIVYLRLFLADLQSLSHMRHNFVIDQLPAQAL